MLRTWLFFAVLSPALALAAPAETTAEVDFPQGPLPAGTKAGGAHAPFEDGDCSICHERKDPQNVGKINMPIQALCESCHEDFLPVMKRPHVHKPTKKSCVNCHNAHNTVEKMLLHAPMPQLCAPCHEDSVKEMSTFKVKHLALERDKKCSNCHDSHASNFERLLLKNPFDMCQSCHTADDVKDKNGKVLANMGKLITNAKVLHKPVAEKDCSACHAPHASDNFRLLVDPYPAAFYVRFDPENYALCFECHKAEIVSAKETTTLTRFRDGARNLHYVHVNIEDRGRNCRACHEVHASNHPRLIRNAVPYGPKGWMLKTNFKPTPTGGTCEKTCHPTQSYSFKADAKAADPGVAPTKGSGSTKPATKAPPKPAAPAAKGK